MNKREIDQTIKKLIKGLVIYHEKAEPFSDKDYWSGTIFNALDTLPTLESFSGKKPKPSRAPKKKKKVILAPFSDVEINDKIQSKRTNRRK